MFAEYPALRNSPASVGSDGSIFLALCQTPVSVAYRPVINTDREGEHTGWLQIPPLKFVPRAAIASRFGVFVV
jgi:hypothetical protein